MQELQKPEQKGVYELCNTPLLLSLVCLAFAHARAFPPTHAELYEDALDVLLRRWDSSRQIDRDALHPDEKIYRELSTQRKKELFARIAHRTFQKGEYFFRRRDLEEWITAYLATLPNVKAVADLDGPIVLKAIEAQHSILVERAKDIYSFSHLTFQEYFTAHYLKQNQASGAVAHLIAAHLGDSRWREVFLLTASLLSEESANDFFYEMQQGIAQCVAAEPALCDLLRWAAQKAGPAHGPAEQRSAVRLAYIFLALALALARALALAHDLARHLERALDRAIASDLERAIARDLDLARARDLARDLDLARARDLALDRALARARKTSSQVGFDYSLFYAWAYAQLFASELPKRDATAWQAAMRAYPALVAGVVEFSQATGLKEITQALAAATIPLPNALPAAWQHYADRLLTLLQKRDLQREWHFTAEQLEKLDRYFDATEVLVQCLKVATVTDRQAILDGILLPPVADVAATATPTPPVRTKPWWRLW